MMSQAGKVAGPLVAIIGPTAVGKTALSLLLAETLAGEIVSADSRLVYTGMDIGAAKPTPVEQARIPHHLIDLVPPSHTISLAFFQQAAYAAIDSILARGKLPLLVGGTGQYVSAVIEGWGIPEVAPNPALRAALEAQAHADGAQVLWDRLARHDPSAASKIHPNNVRRVIRALEVFLETGQPISSLQQKHPPPYRILQIGLTRPREQLHARIDARLEAMLVAGLVEEVRALREAGYDRHCPAMSGLGYRQIIAYLEGDHTLEQAVEQLRQGTRDFARRQAVWFQKYNQAAQWFNMTEIEPEIIVEYVRGWLESEAHAANQGQS